MKKVLIVDDEKSIRITLGEFLTQDGYRVSQASDFEEAVQILKKEIHDVVILDIIMPRFSGLNLLDYIKKFNKNIQVILMTGGPSVESVSEAFRKKAFDYLIKPVNKTTILDTVERAFKQKHDVELENQIENLKSISFQKFSMVVEQSPISIVITDLKGNIEYVNQEFCNITGYSRNELIGNNPRILKTDNTSLEMYKNLWGSITSGKTWEGQFYNKKKDGSFFWEKAKISPLFDANKQIINFIGYKEDITVQKDLEQQVNKMQKLDSIGRLVGGISHDFNNILTVMSGYIDLMSTRIEKNSPIFPLFQKVETMINKAVSLTNKLLMYSKKETAKPIQLCINNSLTDFSKMLRRIIGEDIELVLDLEKDIKKIEADPIQIDQIVMNLIVNARDALHSTSNKDKKIIIRTSNFMIDENFIFENPGFKKGKYIKIDVIDNGIGICRDNLKKVFEPFYTTKGTEKGTGLGLAIVLGVTQQNNAFIKVESEINRGSIFTVFWPVLNEKRVQVLESSSVVDEHKIIKNSVATILVVEDDKELRELIVNSLGKRGFTVYATENGIDALKILVILQASSSFKIDLAFLDIVIPKMNVMDLTDELLKVYPNIKFLYTSGYNHAFLKDTNRIKEDFEYIKKPYRIEDVISVIIDKIEN
ncbi:MAG: response regulator [Candidatus Delongbacteria bacterium]|nr:response regulator [Candidatus Delongbacteria bacterium]MBN2833791.1 response regulator [Candidatus Delongbacteria bacterium]